jgi:hypothetical protein
VAAGTGCSYERNIKVKLDIQIRASEVTDEVISLLIEMGLVYVFIGIEAGSNSLLHGYNELTTVEDNTRAMENFSKYENPSVEMGYIMFELEVTMEEIWECFLWLKQHKKICYKAYFAIRSTAIIKPIYIISCLKKLVDENAQFWDRYKYCFENAKVNEFVSELE